MDNLKLLGVAVLGAVVALVGFMLVGQPVGQLLGGAGIGQNHYQTENFIQGLYAGTSGQFRVTNAGAITTSGAQNNSSTLTVEGATALRSTLTVTGETRTPLVEMGTVATLTTNATTATLTAAQVCDSNVIAWSPGASASATLPTAALVFADCLTTNGDYVSFLFNDDSATSTNTITIKAAASTTLIGPAAGDDIIAIGTSAYVKLIRVSVDEMIGIVETLVDAD